jgi:hypothetical protein
MNPEAVRKMLQEVIQQQQVTLTWWTYLIFAVLAVLSTYLGAYLKKKGETFATREDFNVLLAQVKKTNRATEQIKTAIAKRSDFEKQILLDQYKMVVDLETNIMTISTNLNRLRSGTQIPEFIVDGDIVPLTRVFEQLAINRWLLRDQFHSLFLHQARLLLAIANERDAGLLRKLLGEWEQSVTNFSEAMDRVFKISTITWNADIWDTEA